GQVARTDGFTKNVTSGKDLDNVAYESARASLTLRPTDDLENQTVYYWLHSDNNGTGIKTIELNTQAILAQVPGIGPVTTGPLPDAKTFISVGAGRPLL